MNDDIYDDVSTAKKCHCCVKSRRDMIAFSACIERDTAIVTFADFDDMKFVTSVSAASTFRQFFDASRLRQCRESVCVLTPNLCSLNE